tara:strand:- start:1433 stop:1822 length:390 start_codon:yes stop_codon:yes gene_type:complete
MAFDFPSQFRFADSHEYASVEEDLIKVGISAFAVDQLGDIVFVDLPDIGASIERGSPFGSVESVKAVEDMYAPISGEIIQVNESVLASPEALQNDPHGQGWLLKVRPADLSQLQDLMDAKSYESKVAVK